MKYNDNGTYKDIYIKSFDTLPVGTEVDYDGQTVPSGWTEVPSTNAIVVNLTTTQANISITTSYRLVKIPLNNEYLKIGTKLSFDSTNNNIVIGSGVHHVRISAQSYLGEFSNNQNKERILVIIKNTNSWLAQSDDIHAYNTRDKITLNISNCIVSVSEGDTISLQTVSEVVETYKINGSDDLKTFITVEVID